MGYIFDSTDAQSYDAWFDKAKNTHAFNLEIDLLLRTLAAHKYDRVLDIGCGTGQSLEPLLNEGFHLTGVDPSTPMLDLARARLGDKVDLHRGVAEALPFEDNAFDHAIFFTSLEFTERPAKAVEEACRVARNSVIIGVLNSHAPLNILRRVKSFFVSTPFAHAHYFSIWELKKILYAIIGDVPLTWRTTLQFPLFTGPIAGFIEQQPLMERSPIGTMIIMKIKPVPKFRTRPMWLRVQQSRNYDPVSGFARMPENCIDKQ